MLDSKSPYHKQTSEHVIWSDFHMGNFRFWEYLPYFTALPEEIVWLSMFCPESPFMHARQGLVPGVTNIVARSKNLFGTIKSTKFHQIPQTFTKFQLCCIFWCIAYILMYFTLPNLVLWPLFSTAFSKHGDEFHNLATLNHTPPNLKLQ